MALMMTTLRALSTAQGAGGMGPAHGQAPPEAAQGVQMAQNTQELSLTTPVLFYGKCKDGKSIPPNAFLMELEARQTRHGWEPSMLLRFVKSCLRGEAALWWEGCILSYGDDQDQGPAENYAAFRASKDGARSYAAEQVDKRGDTLYTDRRMMLLLMDKIVEFERTDKSRRNPTIAEATLAEDDGATIEAVKANKKKGKGKGKGNVSETNVAATYVSAAPRTSSKQCKFCDKAGHVESECYTKQNLEKFKHKMVSKVTVEKEPTFSGNGHC
jgi:hypothetical protein